MQFRDSLQAACPGISLKKLENFYLKGEQQRHMLTTVTENKAAAFKSYR